MVDNRAALRKGQELNLAEGRCFMIGDVVGRGGSCIVYEAEYRDTLGHSHRVRVKECYPYLLNLSRRENGCLEVAETVRKRFDEEKQRFQKAYERNTEIKNTLGMMNSTVNPMNIYNANNTVYTVMECNEALNYAAYMEAHPEESLPLFFTRMKALAQVIEKYHQKGILYLDIKPENMLVIGETAELILLFDFDSLLTEEELKYGKEVRISFSDGFTAPEQKNGQRNKIGRHTDIYAIGAIVYHRLFGKSPEYNQGTKNATYNYKTMLCADERYQPALYRKLDEFFHKTIAGATVLRWKNMQDVISCLDELILLSDLKREFLCDNFTYSSYNFVGRERELEDIERCFSDNHVVFLSGIGGIGKTELARRYAHLNRGNFRTVVFATFRKNIMEMVCSEEFKIANYEEDASLPLSERFVQKLGALQKLLSKDDLVILDNFDVEEDDNLEELLEKCPCRFLITTREDYRDYNYLQIEVTEIEGKEELLRLFEAYNSKYGNYEEEEQEYVEKIIELVECHTMTVELIAKYLRDSVDTPQLLYDKMCQKEGITSVDDTLVKNRKDKKLRNESINEHMLHLFELSKFSENQLEFMRSMSLMGDIRISRKLFLEWCDIEENEAVLQYLIRRGWVQCAENSEKIALHQIILDMVYNYLQPTSENCPHIVRSMIAYAEEVLETYEQQWNRLMVLGTVLDRIQGLDESYFKLMTVGGWLLFGWNLKSNRSEDVLDAAFLCLDKLLDDFEDVDIQQKYVEADMQRKVFHLHAILEDAREWDVEGIEKKVILERLQCVADVGKWVLLDEENPHISSNCKVKCLWHTAASMRTMLSELMEDFVKENPDMVNSLLSVAKKSLDKIEKYIEDKEFDQWKEAYYEAMENFYFGREFAYALEKGVIAKAYMQSYRNAGKVIYYQLKQEKGYVSTMTEVLGKFALHSKIAGNYYCALQFYLKAYNRIRWKFWNSDYRLQMWEYDIAECYNMLGETKKAIKILLRADKRNGLDKEQYSLLINLLKQEGREQEAKQYAERNITAIAGQLADEIQKKELEAEDGERDGRIEDIQEWQLVSLTQKYNHAVTEWEKEKIWKECLSVYRELVSENGLLEDSLLYGEKESGILDFYCLNLQRLLEEENSSKESIKLQMDIFMFVFERCYYKEEWKERWNNLRLLYEDLISKYKIQVREGECLYNYLLYIEIKWLKRLEEKDGAWQDVKLEETFSAAGAKCDFCMIAEQRGVGKNNEKKYELWEDAEQVIDTFKRYEDREVCFENQFALLEPVFGLLNMEKCAGYWRAFEGGEVNEEDVRKSSIFYFWGKVQHRLDNIVLLENHDKTNKLVSDLYEKLIQYYGYELFTREDAKTWQGMFSEWKQWDKGKNKETFLYETNNQEYARRVNDLADYLHQLDMNRQAAILGMLSIYIGLTEEPDKEFLRAAFPDPEREGSVELLTAKVGKRLKQSVDSKFTPVVCERVVDMLEWFPEDEDLQISRKNMEVFLAKYQEVEFK